MCIYIYIHYIQSKDIHIIYNHPGMTRMWNWMELTIVERIIPIWDFFSVSYACSYFDTVYRYVYIYIE